GATDLVDGLDVVAYVRSDPGSAVGAILTRSGVYSVSGLPGLRDFERGDGDDDAAWSAPLRRYRVEVRDPQGRFIPFGSDADLPARGLFTGMASLSPAQPLVLPTEHGSPPSAMIGRVPLFSAPSRRVAGSLAAVHADLRELDGERPASFALV